MLIRGCHAPVLVRQGTAEARHRAPTYRERWVKNDGSGTLGYFGNQRSPRFLGLRFCMLCMHPLALRAGFKAYCSGEWPSDTAWR